MSDQLSSDLASLRIARDQSPPSARWRILAGFVIVAAIAAAGWFFGLPYLEAKVFKPKVSVTQVALVSPAEAEVRLTSTGYVVPQRISRVGAKISGRIATIHVEQGDKVEAGQLIAELDAADTQAAMRAAKARAAASRAQIATVQAELVDAQRQAKRERQLANQGAAATAVAEDLEARVTSLSAQVDAAKATARAAQAEVEALAINLDFLEISAPISGTVISKPATAGELVGTMAANIVEIADFDSLEVETDVPESRLHMVEVGGPAEIILDAFPGDRHRGKVVDINPRVDRAKATVTVRVKFIDASERILPDMAARVSFLNKELQADEMKEPAKVVVPAAAIAERGGAKVVFVLDGTVVRMKPVRLGEAMGTGFELIEGPSAGTKLVRGPSADLKDGQEVQQEDAT